MRMLIRLNDGHGDPEGAAKGVQTGDPRGDNSTSLSDSERYVRDDGQAEQRCRCPGPVLALTSNGDIPEIDVPALDNAAGGAGGFVVEKQLHAGHPLGTTVHRADCTVRLIGTRAGPRCIDPQSCSHG
ncbi:hypothetical protein ABT202_15475 [Streptomyces sp900105245]|uniref:hypothetical protein n=1 Tax=Streptomyces sp. 900105245 TaxID=3154379 RepID=UPI00332F8018